MLRRTIRPDHDELDALVLEELEALTGRRPLPPRRPAPEEEEPPADSFEEAAPGDEESFIERTADYLRGRPDAEALLDAVRATLAESDGDPAEEGAADEGAPSAAEEGKP